MMTRSFRAGCVLIGLTGMLMPSTASAGLKLFSFDTGDYGSPDANCINSPIPPLFNRPEYGNQTKNYIVDPAGCGEGAEGGSNGSDSRLTGFFSSSLNSNEVRFSWVDPTNDDTWLRLITFSAGSPTVTPVYPGPTVDIGVGSKISMKVMIYGEDSSGTPVAADGSHGLEFSLAIRETGRNLPLGANASGGSEAVEFVGLTSKGGTTDTLTPNGGIRIDQTPCPDITGCSSYFHTIEYTFVDDAGVRKVDVSVDGGAATRLGVVGFSGDGILSAAHDRAMLDSLVIRKPTTDDSTKKWFVYIDDLTIDAPGITDPVQVLGAPILNSATSVTVGSINTDDTTPPAPDGAESVHLYKNGVDVAGSPVVPPYTTATTQTFTGLTLAVGDVLTATQVIGGVESALSDPVTVISAAAYTENFDSYANQAAFAAAWPSINATAPDVILQSATVHTCPNAVAEQAIGTGTSLIRRFHTLPSGLNGTDAQPLWLTYYFYHGANTSQRNYMEVRRYSSGDPTSGTLAKLWAFGCYNSDDHATWSGSKYQVREVNGTGAIGWTTLTAGPNRVNNAWNKMQIKFRATDVSFYINDTLALTTPRTGDAGNLTTLVIGSGLTNSSTAAYYDSFSMSIGTTATDPFSAPPVPQVAVQGPLPAGQTTVTVTGASTAAGTTVFVYDTSSATPTTPIGSASAGGNSTVVVTVPALVAGHVIKAIQKLADNTQSCLGPSITVGDCSPVAAVAVNNGPLTPSTTSVTVTNVSGAGVLVKVYKVVSGTATLLGSATSAGTSVAVTIPANSLAKGNIVSATQTINTVEGCISLTANSNTAVVGSGTNKGILVTLGIRDANVTGKSIGDDGGASSAVIEWIFPAGSVAPAAGGAPQGKLLPVSSAWQTVTFDPTKADGSVLKGSGLTATGDTDHTWAGQYGIIEHLAITQNGADTGPYVLYIDNIVNGTTPVVDFETPAGPPAITQVTFRQPTFSGTTGGNILALPSSSYLSADYGDASLQSDKIQWQFKDEATTRWIRLTTSGVANKPNPVVDLTQPITIRFLLLPPPVTINTQPQTQTVCLNGSVTFNVSATGAGVLHYQWKKDGTTNVGTDSNSLTINPVLAGDAGSYTVTVTDDGGLAPTTSNPAVLTVQNCDLHATAWRSVRAHAGGGGNLSVVLNPVATGNGLAGPAVESRTGGIQRIEVDFDGPITLADTSKVTVSGRTTTAGVMGAPVSYVPTSVVANGANGLALTFSAGLLPDLTCYTVTLQAGLISQNILGDADCMVRSLAGDATGSGTLTLSDALVVKARAGQSVASNVGLDIDLSGVLDNADAQASKAGVSSPAKSALCP